MTWQSETAFRFMQLSTNERSGTLQRQKVRGAIGRSRPIRRGPSGPRVDPETEFIFLALDELSSPFFIGQRETDVSTEKKSKKIPLG